jgi:hypothetical protein
MKTHCLPLWIAAVLVLCAGCQTDDYARRIIAPETTGGRTWMSVAGSGDQLVQQKRIDMCRRIPAPDKTEIDVWVLKAQGTSRGTVVILHGLGESKGMHPYFGAAQRLQQRGYDVVLADLRAHGRSDGKYVTYGAMEKNDVKAVVDALLKEGAVDERIYVFGATLGGTVAIQYAAIDPRCRGVLALTPYKGIAGARVWMPVWMNDQDFQKVLTRAGEIGEFNPAEASCVEAARKLKCPLVLVHGLIDLVVPFENSQAIFDAANEPKKLLAVTPGLERAALLTFFEDWIAEKMDLLVQGKILQMATTGAATTEPAKP